MHDGLVSRGSFDFKMGSDARETVYGGNPGCCMHATVSACRRQVHKTGQNRQGRISQQMQYSG